MRKYVEVVGVGEKRTSKKGWEYVPLSFTFEDKSVHGVKAAHVNVGTDILGNDVPIVGDTLEFVMHESNFQLYVDAVL